MWLLRVWRAGAAHCEQRWMDEHMVLSGGRVVSLMRDFIDDNQKVLTFWTDKHNRYADSEVKDLLALASGTDGARPNGQAGRRRWANEKLYAHSPFFWRAFICWIYRYVILLGFLDGRPGLVFHFLQACWYLLLVDAMPSFTRSSGRFQRTPRLAKYRPIAIPSLRRMALSEGLAHDAFRDGSTFAVSARCAGVGLVRGLKAYHREPVAFLARIACQGCREEALLRPRALGGVPNDA
jgi:hypothetical protein